MWSCWFLDIYFFLSNLPEPNSDDEAPDVDLDDLLDEENMQCSNPGCHALFDQIEAALNERDNMLQMVHAITDQVRKVEENVIEAEQNKGMLEERGKWIKEEITRQREGEIIRKKENEAMKLEYNRMRDRFEQCLRLKQKYSSQVNGLYRKNKDPYAEPQPIEVVFNKSRGGRPPKKDGDESTLHETMATGKNEEFSRPQSGRTRLLDWNVLEDCLKREVVVPPSRPRSAATFLGRTGSGMMRFPAPAAQHQPIASSRSFAVIPGDAGKKRRGSTAAKQPRPLSAGAVRLGTRPQSAGGTRTGGRQSRSHINRPQSASAARGRVT